MASTSLGIQKEQLTAALSILKALADAIKEAGPTGLPSGPLYATVMGVMSLDNYNAAITKLKDLGIISEDSSHVLRWIEVPTAV